MFLIYSGHFRKPKIPSCKPYPSQAASVRSPVTPGCVELDE